MWPLESDHKSHNDGFSTLVVGINCAVAVANLGILFMIWYNRQGVNVKTSDQNGDDKGGKDATCNDCETRKKMFPLFSQDEIEKLVTNLTIGTQTDFDTSNQYTKVNVETKDADCQVELTVCETAVSATAPPLTQSNVDTTSTSHTTIVDDSHIAPPPAHRPVPVTTPPPPPPPGPPPPPPPSPPPTPQTPPPPKEPEEEKPKEDHDHSSDEHEESKGLKILKTIKKALHISTGDSKDKASDDESHAEEAQKAEEAEEVKEEEHPKPRIHPVPVNGDMAEALKIVKLKSVESDDKHTPKKPKGVSAHDILLAEVQEKIEHRRQLVED